MQKLKLESGEMYYQMRGQGNPLVLLHAGVSDSRMWDEIQADLAKDFTVIRCDLHLWSIVIAEYSILLSPRCVGLD